MTTGTPMSGYEMTITRTLHMMGRHASPDSARAFVLQLLDAGELDGHLAWKTAVAVRPFGSEEPPARHPCVTFINAITSFPTISESRCYPTAEAAFEAAATERPYNNTSLSLGWCSRNHDTDQEATRG